MRKYLLLFIFALTIPFGLFAQEEATEEETTETENSSSQNGDSGESPPLTYYVQLDQVAASLYGYKVWYHDSQGRTHTAYLPGKWFYRAGAGHGHNTGEEKYEDQKDLDDKLKASKAYSNRKGVINWTKDTREGPSMVVYYSNGGFSHVILSLNGNLHHRSWRLIDAPKNWQEDEGTPYTEYDEPTNELKDKFESITTIELHL